MTVEPPSWHAAGGPPTTPPPPGGGWSPPPGSGGDWPGPPSGGGDRRLLAPRPQTVGDTLDGAFQVLRAAWPLGLAAVLIITLVGELLNWGILAAFFPDLEWLLPGGGALPSAEQLEQLLAPFLTALLLTNLVSLVLGAASSLVVLVVVDGRDRGATPSLGEALARAARRALGVAVASTILFVGVVAVVAIPAVGLGTIADGLIGVVGLLAIPLLLAAFGAYAMLPAAVVLEGRGAFGALGRVLSITRRRLGRTIGIAFLLFLLLVAISIGAGVLVSLFAFLGEGALAWASVLVSAALGIIGVAIIAGAGAMLLLDAAARLEGADLADRLGGPDDPWGR